MKINTVLSATLTMAGFANAKNVRGGRRLAHYNEDGYTKRQQYKRTRAAVEGSMPSDSTEEFTITLDEAGSEEITIKLDEIDVGGGDVEEEITLKIDLPHERKADHEGKGKGSDDEEEDEDEKIAKFDDEEEDEEEKLAKGDEDEEEEEGEGKKKKGKGNGKTKDLKGKRKGGKGKGK